MRNFLKEFKEFAMRGNVMELAVGIIVGAAFTAIVTSLVDDILSPIIGLLVRVNFSDLALNAGGVTLKYGSFIMAVINFKMCIRDRLMTNVCSYADSVRLPLMLFTNTADDVRFYQSLGFKIIGETSSKKFGFTNTYLIYE